MTKLRFWYGSLGGGDFGWTGFSIGFQGFSRAREDLTDFINLLGLKTTSNPTNSDYRFSAVFVKESRIVEKFSFAPNLTFFNFQNPKRPNRIFTPWKTSSPTTTS
jgi:hypothetical protein